MKVGKKMQSRIEVFCRDSSELLQSIHVRCGDVEGEANNGQPKRERKKRRKKRNLLN